MNWVGGSRKRLLMKDDAKRQREFFEKRKMQQRLEKMGVTVHGSSTGSTSTSMDMVTLFVVNQIASKNNNKDPPKVALFGGRKDLRRKVNQPLVLPMSPTSPSKLSLMDSQHHSSLQAPRKKKNMIPQAFKSQQLSPVIESVFSDITASDYLPSSPFSSKSPASSGTFSLQLNPPQRSQQSPLCDSSPWETSGLEQTKFQPFSEPMGICDGDTWTRNSDLFQQHSASEVLFGEPQLDVEQAHEVVVDLTHYKNLYQEPTRDFINVHETDDEQPFAMDVYRDFFHGDTGTTVALVASDSGTPNAKIDTNNASPLPLTPQTVSDTKSITESFIDTSKLTCECSNQKTNHSYPSLANCHRGSCSSSVSSDDSCQPDDLRCCDQNLHSSLSQRFCSKNPRKSTKSNPMDDPLLTPSFLSLTCSECSRTTNPLQDTGTQTDANVEKNDAETQYELHTPESILCPAHLDVSIPVSATGRHTGYKDEDRSKEPLQSRFEQADVFPQSRRPILEGNINSFQDHDIGQLHGLPEMEKDEKVKTSAKRCHLLSDESETLQDIASILLLLHERMKEE